MEHFAVDIPQWEMEAGLAYEADPIMDLALDAIQDMNHEQRLALLDRLGIEYAKYMVEEPEPEVEAEVPLFDKLFKL